MKITKEYLNRVIKEELQKIIEGDVLQFRGRQEQGNNDGQLYDKPAEVVDLKKKKVGIKKAKKALDKDTVVIDGKRFYKVEIDPLYAFGSKVAYDLHGQVSDEVFFQFNKVIINQLYIKKLYMKALPSQIAQNVLEIYESQPNFIFKNKIINSLRDIIIALKSIEMEKQIV